MTAPLDIQRAHLSLPEEEDVSDCRIECGASQVLEMNDHCFQFEFCAFVQQLAIKIN